MADQEKWEYTSTILFANVDNEGAKEYIKNRWPKWTTVRQFSPETIIPELDKFGNEGWELMHMEPVAIQDENMSIAFSGTQRIVSSAQFCVVNRKQVELHPTAPDK